MYQESLKIKVPEREEDLIAAITAERFNYAVAWQSRERIGNKTVREVLRECYEQRHGILSCEDAAIAEEIGVNVYVNLSASKCNVVRAKLYESLVQGGEMPWAYDATPIPSLSDKMKLEALALVKEQLFANQYDGELVTLIRQVKNTLLSKEKHIAQQAAERMLQLSSDQSIEGGWRTSQYGFLSDFVVYPYAVLQGPVPQVEARLKWEGDKLRTVKETIYGVRNISVWDFWWTPDSPDTQRGSGIFVRERWTRQQLLMAGRMKSYMPKQIEKVLERFDTQDKIVSWMKENPEQYDSELKIVNWRETGGTVEVLKHYGFFSGKELSKMGVQHVDDNEQYNAVVTMIDGVTIQAFVEPNPSVNIRPVHTASFDCTQDRIPGEGICQKVRDVERCYLVALRYLMRNAANSSEPITEADYARLSKYMNEDDIGRLIPGTWYLTSADLANGGAPAMRFHNVPSNTGAYLQLLQFFESLTDRVSNVPAAFHGEPVGTGANRTFRGMAMLQGNAFTAIQASVNNIDEYVYKPYAGLLYNYNMVYGKDEDVKGDCQIRARGATALLQREIDKQNAYELLQLIGSAGNQLMTPDASGKPIMNPDILRYAFNTLLSTMNVPDEYLNTGPGTGNPDQGQPMDPAAMEAAPPGMQVDTSGAELMSEVT